MAIRKVISCFDETDLERAKKGKGVYSYYCVEPTCMKHIRSEAPAMVNTADKREWFKFCPWCGVPADSPETAPPVIKNYINSQE
jgi:hypothetical protein